MNDIKQQFIYQAVYLFPFSEVIHRMKSLGLSQCTTQSLNFLQKILQKDFPKYLSHVTMANDFQITAYNIKNMF